MKQLREEINNLIQVGLQYKDICNTANQYYNGDLKYHTVYRYAKGIHTNIPYDALLAISKGVEHIKDELLFITICKGIEKIKEDVSNV